MLIKFRNGATFSIDSDDYGTILHLLSVQRYSQIFQPNRTILKISFDGINTFNVSLNELTNQDKAILALLDLGLKEGAFFIDKDHAAPLKNDKIVKIIQDEKSIIETSEGIRFLLEATDPAGIVEAFVRRIHDQYSHDLMNKIVIDIGASNGDTPLYFASKGARVYAFEMTKTNYDEMIKNLELNPNLSSKITPAHVAVGKDELIEYYQDSLERLNSIGGASFVVNKYGKNSSKHTVTGMTIKTVLEKFDISSVDLLKLDCKGCEFFLKKNELKNTKRIKIEYYVQIKDQKVKAIINMLKELNYNLIIYKHTTTDTSPIEKHGNILAET